MQVFTHHQHTPSSHLDTENALSHCIGDCFVAFRVYTNTHSENKQEPPDANFERNFARAPQWWSNYNVKDLSMNDDLDFGQINFAALYIMGDKEHSNNFVTSSTHYVALV